MDSFPEFKGRDFYIVGESYGGHYVLSYVTTVRDTLLTHFDPCNNVYVHQCLNWAEVQIALHAKFTSWVFCRNAMEIYDTMDVLGKTTPLLPNIMANGVPILVFSGDFDSVVSFMSTKNVVLKKLNLTEVVQWSPWKYDDEVVGHHIVYGGVLTYTTIKGAGHMVLGLQFVMIKTTTYDEVTEYSMHCQSYHPRPQLQYI